MTVGVNVTDDLIWEVQDQVQRVERKLDWLVAQAGGDPVKAGALPDGPQEHAEAA